MRKNKKMGEIIHTPVIVCNNGGCTAKLGPEMLHYVLNQLPKGVKDDNLLVGYESSDDAAVYQLNDRIAFVQTLDFFPPMIDDPYLFGKIAATNALSDIYAMGGEVKTALNIVCFPETYDLNILGEILRGGAEQVMAAGGTIAGGHSIYDHEIKYGLSVTGIIDPKKIYSNCGVKKGDQLILTKKLGTGIITTANRATEQTDVSSSLQEGMKEAIESMTTLNKDAANVIKKYKVHACTDVTGFGLLGHLHEMLHHQYSAHVNVQEIPYFLEAYHQAEEFMLTGAAQRNRNHLSEFVHFEGVTFPMEEILYDPQTSGGLLIAVAPEDAKIAEEELQSLGMPAKIIGEILDKDSNEIFVIGTN